MSSESVRLLLIEDNPGDARLVREVLREAASVELHVADRLALGLEHLAVHDTDVVLLDLGLPDSQGLDTVRETSAAAPRVPIVVLTGVDDESLAVQAVKAGAQDYLIKGEIVGRLILRAARYAMERKRAERELADQHSTLRAILESVGAPVFSLDREYRYTSFNQAHAVAMRALYGVEIQIGQSLLDYQSVDEDRVVSRRNLDRALGGEVFVESAFSGEEVRSGLYFEVAHYPVRNDRGEVIGVSVFARDVTERKRAEDALRESEARFRTVFHSSPVSIALTRIADNRLVDVNQAWVKARGIDRDEAIGRTPADLNTWVDPTERDRLVQALREKSTVQGFEVQMRRRSGGIVDMLMVAEPIEVAGDRCMLTMAVDITERKRAEDALRLSERRFRAVFEGVTDGILVLDVESEAFVMANPAICRTLGYSEGELLRLGIKDIHPVEHLPAVQEVVRKQISGELRLATDIPVRKKDGTTFFADINSMPVLLGDRRCLLGVFRDTTAFKEMEAQMRQAQKMEAIGQLAGGVAHDFNNILGVVLGHCDLMLRTLREDDPLFRNVTQIRLSGERAATLTRQLLAFGRRQPLQAEVIDLNTTVGSLNDMLGRLIGEDIDLKTTLDADLGCVRADPGQIEQVIINLAVNARDAMPQGGKLIIETANVDLDHQYAKDHARVTPGGYVMLAVTDTGSGMDASTRERIFEPFFTTKEKSRGTGLGLSTVYGIVKQSGGHVWVYSEIGQGSTFKIYLPRTDEAVIARAERISGDPLRGSGEVVLVVEDDPDIREIVRGFLDALGFRAVIAANAGEALLSVEEGQLRPELLITDLIMPGMNGAVLAERLRRILPEMKALFMSGYTDDGVVQQGILQAGTPFIQKPFKIADLAAKVDVALRR